MNRERARPALLLLPLVALFVATLWIVRRQQHASGPPFRPEVVEAVSVSGFSGELVADVGTLRAQLAPLHGDPERSAFDAAVLAERLGLEAGEPWLLELAWEAGAGPGGLDLVGLAVEDAEGEALTPLEPQPAGSQPVDPLRVLLAPPTEPLAPGQGLELFLWGRAPGDEARVRGGGPLAGDGLRLMGVELSSVDLPRSLARLETREEAAASSVR